MGLFTRGKVWISADRSVYIEHDPGTGITSFPASLGLGTAAGVHGFYGSTPVTQPAHTAQAAVSTNFVTGVVVTATSIVTTGAIAGFQNLAQVTALLTHFNALRTQVDAQGSMLNAIRLALVQTSGVGLIKGSN